MSASPANNYLKTKVFTATPEQLQLMLYDGAIRFTEQARAALVQKNRDASYSLIIRAQKIISELLSGLKHDVAPELCGKLASLYTFCYRKLIDANLHHRVEDIDEALGILRYQRDTWMMLLDQLGKKKAAAAAASIDMPAPSAAMEARISLTG
jgi:flagellar protein FliS